MPQIVGDILSVLPGPLKENEGDVDALDTALGE